MEKKEHSEDRFWDEEEEDYQHPLEMLALNLIVVVKSIHFISNV